MSPYTAGMIASFFSLLLAAAVAAPAGGHVYRCQGAHGETVYSGLPCDQREDLRSSPTHADAFERDDSWGGRCADLPEELSDRVAAAFDSGNVNALGGLFLWRGYGTRAAYARLNELKAMLRKPLAGLSLVPRFGSAWQSLPGVDIPDAAQDLRVEVAIPGLGEAREVWRFPVLESDGCYWLQFADMPISHFP